MNDLAIFYIRLNPIAFYKMFFFFIFIFLAIWVRRYEDEGSDGGLRVSGQA